MNIHGPSSGHEFGRMDPAHSLERSKSLSLSQSIGGGALPPNEGQPSAIIETANLFARLRDQPEIREGVLPPVVSKIQSGYYNKPESAQRLADAILGQADLA